MGCRRWTEQAQLREWPEPGKGYGCSDCAAAILVEEAPASVVHKLPAGFEADNAEGAASAGAQVA
jgi:hypothetical protein